MVEGLGINFDRLRLENIKPGVPSFRAREAVDSDYEPWLRVPTEVRREQRAQAPIREPEGPRAKSRAQYARVQWCYNTDCTHCAQEVIAGTWHKPPASLPLSLQEPF